MEQPISESFKSEVPVPEEWTVLYHGTNFSREEWQGDKLNLLDADYLRVKARFPGLSCIDSKEKGREAEESTRMRAHFDTTDGFSRARPGIDNKPGELRIVIPLLHDRMGQHRVLAEQYFRNVLDHDAFQVLKEFTNNVYWRKNNQHPVIPNGTVLKKLTDQTLTDGKRIIWYVPQLVENIYQHYSGLTK